MINCVYVIISVFNHALVICITRHHIIYIIYMYLLDLQKNLVNLLQSETEGAVKILCGRIKCLEMAKNLRIIWHTKYSTVHLDRPWFCVCVGGGGGGINYCR